MIPFKYERQYLAAVELAGPGFFGNFNRYRRSGRQGPFAGVMRPDPYAECLAGIIAGVERGQIYMDPLDRSSGVEKQGDLGFPAIGEKKLPLGKTKALAQVHRHVARVIREAVEQTYGIAFLLQSVPNGIPGLFGFRGRLPTYGQPIDSLAEDVVDVVLEQADEIPRRQDAEGLVVKLSRTDQAGQGLADIRGRPRHAGPDRPC